MVRRSSCGERNMEMINNISSISPVSSETVQVRALPEPVIQVNGVAAVEPVNTTQNARSDLSDKSQTSAQPNYLLKLTVEKDPDTGEFIYKAIDRYTGEVVRQLPQKELLDLRNTGTYRPGAVIETDI